MCLMPKQCANPRFSACKNSAKKKFVQNDNTPALFSWKKYVLRFRLFNGKRAVISDNISRKTKKFSLTTLAWKWKTFFAGSLVCQWLTTKIVNQTENYKIWLKKTFLHEILYFIRCLIPGKQKRFSFKNMKIHKNVEDAVR